jgi:hypothetical protein
MSTAREPSTLSEYFAYLEARYGERFSLDALTDDELARLAGLGAQTLAGQPCDTDIMNPVDTLVGLVQNNLARRAGHRLITCGLSS